mgnify:CR=1 FL=1
MDYLRTRYFLISMEQAIRIIIPLMMYCRFWLMERKLEILFILHID